jgi:hypothetical protein
VAAEGLAGRAAARDRSSRARSHVTSATEPGWHPESNHDARSAITSLTEAGAHDPTQAQIEGRDLQGVSVRLRGYNACAEQRTHHGDASLHQAEGLPLILQGPGRTFRQMTAHDLEVALS